VLNKFRQKLAFELLVRLKRKTQNRKPDFVISEQYMKRWWLLPKNPIMNVYYHEIKGSDLDRHLHDHPFFFAAFILEGGYDEHTTSGVEKRAAGDIYFHSPWKLHKLLMNENEGASTIFVTLFKIRKWGFMTEEGWVPRNKYISEHGLQSQIEHIDTEEPEYEKSSLDSVTIRINSWMRKLVN
jgi:hypothetical protein